MKIEQARIVAARIIRELFMYDKEIDINNNGPMMLQVRGELVASPDTFEKIVTEIMRKPKRKRVRPKMRFDVMERDGFACVYCGRSRKKGATLHIDHVKPVRLGGKTTMRNLVTACEQCNSGKGARRLIAKKKLQGGVV